MKLLYTNILLVLIATVGINLVSSECELGCMNDSECESGYKCTPKIEDSGNTNCENVCKKQIVETFGNQTIKRTEIKDPISQAASPSKQDSASGFGDPHFRTYDGTHYSFHGQCDLLMARSEEFSNGLGIDVHARTEIVASGGWSLISNVAVRIGDDIFELSNDENYYFNGITNVPLPIKLAGKYDVKKTEKIIETIIRKKNGVNVPQKNKRIFITITLDNDERIRMTLFKKMIAVNVDAYLPDTHGMLGVHGNNGMIGRDGVTNLQDPNEMGIQWQVNDSEPMLFQEIKAPQYPEACILPSVKSRHLRSSIVSEEQALLACTKVNVTSPMLSFCIDDVLRTEDVLVATSYENENLL